MRFTEVTLVNVGPFFGERTFKFKQGSVGIFGANGSGKTTLIDAAFACITNDYGRFYDRNKLVNNQCGEKDPVTIEVKLEHEGANLRMFQDLRKSKFEFRVNKDKAITSRNSAMEILAELGIDRKILDFCVFKRQPGCEKNAIDDFLRTTPTARAEAYMILNQTQHCGTVYDVVGDVLNHDKEFTEEIIDNSDELLAIKGELEALAADMLSQKQKAEANMMKPEHAAKAKDVVAKSSRVEKLKAREVSFKDEVLKAGTDLQQAQLRQTKRQKLLVSAEDDVKTWEPRADAAKATLAKLAQFTQKRDRLNKLEAAIGVLKKEAAGRQPPVPITTTAVEIVESKQHVAGLRAKLEAAKKTLAVFGKRGKMSCPTCGQDVAPIQDHLDEMQNDVDNLPGVIQIVEDAILAYDAYHKAKTIYDAWKDGWDKRYASTEENRKEAANDFLTFVFTSVDETELKHTVDTYKLTVESVDNQNKLVQQSAVEVGRLTEILKAATNNLADIQQEITESTFTKEVIERATKRLTEHNAAEIEIATIRGRLEGVQEKIARAEVEIQNLAVRLERGHKVRRAVKILNRVHDAFHAKALPQRVAEGNLALMEGDINRNLELLGDPFWIETAKGLSFQIHKPGEPPQMAEQLSGGQKAVLAMAFWPALNSLYKTSGGMLVLDEPTANLDEANQKFLREALEALSKSVRGRRQVIIVTHAELLKPAFDQIIQL